MHYRHKCLLLRLTALTLGKAFLLSDLKFSHCYFKGITSVKNLVST